MPKGVGYGVQAPAMTGAKKRTAPSGVDPTRGLKKRKKKDRAMMAPR